MIRGPSSYAFESLAAILPDMHVFPGRSRDVVIHARLYWINGVVCLNLEQGRAYQLSLPIKRVDCCVK
jgi:hypothetical protein